MTPASRSVPRQVAGTPATRMRSLLEDLYPLPRSITGDGLRATLGALRRELPDLVLNEVPSGTRVFDWTVPPEWNVRGARLTGPDNRVVADFDKHNLMLVNYSAPFDGNLTLGDLQSHLHSLPERPEVIPYVTSYYDRGWGFCLPHADRVRLEPGEYRVSIDTTLEAGSLTYAELLVTGNSTDEVLLSAHVCHPSLANDNLSAVAVLVELARWLQESRRRLSYRILFAPGTIGTIAFLARSPEARQRIKHGLVLAGLGDTAALTYKETLSGEAFIDRVVKHVLRHLEQSAVLPFDPSGYDERQYASPGIRLPVGRLGRAVPASYPEYHTSADDLSFVQDTSLDEALETLKQIVTTLEIGGLKPVNLAPYGEPQLGRRGLYSSADCSNARAAVLWVLALSDGENTLLDIAERSGFTITEVMAARDRLVEGGLLAPGSTKRAPKERG